MSLEQLRAGPFRTIPAGVWILQTERAGRRLLHWCPAIQAIRRACQQRKQDEVAEAHLSSLPEQPPRRAAKLRNLVSRSHAQQKAVATVG